MAPTARRAGRPSLIGWREDAQNEGVSGILASGSMSWRHIPGPALIASLALIAATVAQAATRGIEVEIKTTKAPGAPVAETVRLYDKSHALVIGIDRYTDGWPNLANAVEDAELVAAALGRRGFEVTLRRNLDSFALQAALREFFVLKGADPEARLLLWYAGHGATLDGEGFLVPADAPPATDPRFKLVALPFRDFGSLVRLAEAKHALSVFDSCFAGTVFTSRGDAPPAAITRKTTAPVRQFLTSGDAGQRVRDDGSFRTLFLRALAGEADADFNGDHYLTGEELGLFLSQEVAALTDAAQTPRYGKLQDVRYDQGDFVFVLPAVAVEPVTIAEATEAVSDDTAGLAIELAFWNAIAESADPRDFEDYLEHFPQGTFSGLAERRLAALAGQEPDDAADTLTDALLPAPPTPSFDGRWAGLLSTSVGYCRGSIPIEVTVTGASALARLDSSCSLRGSVSQAGVVRIDGLCSPREYRIQMYLDGADASGTWTSMTGDVSSATAEPFPRDCIGRVLVEPIED